MVYEKNTSYSPIYSRCLDNNHGFFRNKTKGFNTNKLFSFDWLRDSMQRLVRNKPFLCWAVWSTHLEVKAKFFLLRKPDTILGDHFSKWSSRKIWKFKYSIQIYQVNFGNLTKYNTWKSILVGHTDAEH